MPLIKYYIDTFFIVMSCKNIETYEDIIAMICIGIVRGFFGVF